MDEQKEIFVVGNGKSLKDFDFNYLKDKKWIGTCLGFRHWDIINIYPTHYVCVDNVVCNHHRKKILEMVKEKKCESFLICGSLFQSDIGEELKKYNNVIPFQHFMLAEQNPFRYLIDYCTGSSAVLYGYCLDFDIINLLGMDCKYVEFIPECIKNEKDNTLTILETPKENPNYYFNEYQQVGDIYNKPNVDKVHKKSWWDIRNIILLFNLLRHREIKLYNYTSKDNEQLKELFQLKDINELSS